MRKSLILAGSGGCMRELIWQIEELNKQQTRWDILGYVDISDEHGDVQVGKKVYPYLGTDEYLLACKEKTNVVVAVGGSKLRRKIAEKLMTNPHLEFPNLILSNTSICSDVQLGKGNIISMDCRISTNVFVGDFTFLNMGTVVCHDGKLGDYVSLSPDVRLAGNVTIGNNSELGMGTKVIQGVRIGEEVTTGAGSVVINDLPDNCVVVGVPAKIRKYK